MTTTVELAIEVDVEDTPESVDALQEEDIIAFLKS